MTNQIVAINFHVSKLWS